MRRGQHGHTRPSKLKSPLTRAIKSAAPLPAGEPKQSANTARSKQGNEEFSKASTSWRIHGPQHSAAMHKALANELCKGLPKTILPFWKAQVLHARSNFGRSSFLAGEPKQSANTAHASANTNPDGAMPSRVLLRHFFGATTCQHRKFSTRCPPSSNSARPRACCPRMRMTSEYRFSCRPR